MLKHMASNGGVGSRMARLDASLVENQQSKYRSGNTNNANANTNTTASTSTSRMQQSFVLPLSLNASAAALNASKLPATATSPIMNKTANGGLVGRPRSAYATYVPSVKHNGTATPATSYRRHIGVKEMLVSLGLLCLVSLLLALLSLIFLLKISPVTANDIRELLRAEQLTLITAEEYTVVYEVTLALCAVTLSLNLCCLLVCAIQFLFAVKLVKSPHGGNDRTNQYLQKSSITRVCAVGGFFISIPVFLTGIILYTFIQFHSVPAIVTSIFIGLGIIFCGCAMVHNVFIWQREKTNAVKELALQQHETILQQHQQQQQQLNGNVSYNHSFMMPLPLPLPLHNSTAVTAHNTTPYILRPATTTPPTGVEGNKMAVPASVPVPVPVPVPTAHPREASGTGSVSPGMPPMPDLSSVATTNSPHELSTLV